MSGEGAREGDRMIEERVLELAMQRGVTSAEVFAAEAEQTPVVFEANKLKSLQTTHTRGVALRVIKNGRIGFAASTRPNDAEALVDLALELSEFGAEATFTLPGRAPLPEAQVYDPKTPQAPVKEMADLGRALIDAVLGVEPEVVCDAEVSRHVQRVRLLNSAGVDAVERLSSFSVSLSGQRVVGDDILWVGDEVSSCSPLFDPSLIAGSVRNQLEWAREVAVVTPGEMPVLFTPLGVASVLLEPLLTAFSGRMVYQGASPLADSLGQAKYDSALSIWDDPLTPLRPSSRSFDDEGVPSRRQALVDAGVVSMFMYDLQTAGLAGKSSTGHAHRSLTSQPVIAATTVTLSPGTKDFAALLREMGDGVVVEQMIGADQGNVLGGDFSGNVILGYKVERGQITGRVKNTMVAGNVHGLLARIGAVGADARWVGSVSTPSLLFQGVSVSSAD